MSGMTCQRAHLRRWWPVVVLCLSVTTAAWARQPLQARYVFLFIGDGMGLAQRTAGELYQSAMAGEEGPAPQAKLAMNSLPVMGLSTTYSRNAMITDSAAAGTALACGYKTDSGAIAMDPADGRKFMTIAQLAKRSGMRVGIVTDVSIDHATPACFYAHQPARGEYYEIAMQLPASGFDYFAGAKPLGETPREGQGPSPYEAARQAGYTIVTTVEEFRALKPGGGKVWVSADNVPYEIDRPAGVPSLAEYTRKGIELLAGEEGFFMMVEAGRLDWACHANDAAATVREVLALDKAVAAAVEFYLKHPSETLIVVTADHETGGMMLGSTGAAARPSYAALAGQRFFSRNFRARVRELRDADTPFEQGLAAIEAAFGLGELTAEERGKLEVAYALSMTDEPRSGEDMYRRYGGGDPLTAACAHVVALRAGIGWTTWGHTALPVPTSAGGVGSEKFGGYYHLAEIPRRIAAVMGLAAQFPPTASDSLPEGEPAEMAAP